MANEIKSRRGYYYDLNHSPYVLLYRNGERFAFPSNKKKEIFINDYRKRITTICDNLDKLHQKTGVKIPLDSNTIYNLFKHTYTEHKERF